MEINAKKNANIKDITPNANFMITKSIIISKDNNIRIRLQRSSKIRHRVFIYTTIYQTFYE